MRPDGQDVLQSDEWQECVRDHRRGRELAPRLDASDVSSLIRHLKSASDKEQEAAIHLLQFALKEKIPVNEQQKKDLLMALQPIVAAYPDHPVGQALVLMSKLDETSTSQFLLEEVDGLRIAEWRFRGYLGDLSPSPAVVDRIVQYSKLPGPRGATAARLLKSMGIIEQKEVEELAARWRVARSVQTLNDLYEFYISHKLCGKPMKLLLELLGPPTTHDSSSCWYLVPPELSATLT
jgi:hypothetical protein